MRQNIHIKILEDSWNIGQGILPIFQTRLFWANSVTGKKRSNSFVENYFKKFKTWFLNENHMLVMAKMAQDKLLLKQTQYKT